MATKTRITSILSDLPKTGRKKVAGRIAADKIGQRLRELRKSRDLSLADASSRTGVPAATISRIETNKMSPTFGILSKIMDGMGYDWGHVLTDSPKSRPAVSVSRNEDVATRRLTGIPYEYSLLHQARSTSMTPLRMQIDARTLEEAGGLAGHEGEEFCYVLSGTLELHLENQEILVLKAGESALFMSNHPHAYVSKHSTRTNILLVLNHSEELISSGSMPKKNTGK